MSFQPGDLIWAKMRGYPHWPARIDLPATNEKIPAKKYAIFFYGTHETAVMQVRDLFEYEKHKAKYSKPSTRKFFKEALEEIIKDPKVRYGQRGMPVESESEESSGSEEEENEEEEQEEDTSSDQKQVQGKRRISTENKTPAKKKAKTTKTAVSDSEEPVESDEPEESSESEGEEYVPEHKGKKKKETQPKAKATKSKDKTTSKKPKKIISSDESSEDEDDDDSSKKIEKQKNSDSEDSLSSREEKKDKKAIKEKNEVKSKQSSDSKTKHKDEEEDNIEETEEEKKKKKEETERRKQEKLEKRKEELKEKKRKEKLEQKAKQKEKEKQEKEKEKERKLKEKEKEKERALKEKEKEKARMEKEKQREKERKEKEKQKEKEKIEWQKRKERLKNPTIYDTLELCNQDLKLSLTVEAPDLQKCLNTLNKINDMQISPDVIKKSPAIVQTIKKIRNYKQSNKVKERASEVYTKLKSLFIVSDTPVTPTTTQNPLTPAEQKITENSSKPLVKTEKSEDGKEVSESVDKTEEESNEQANLVEATPLHDKENVLLDHKTQNGAHSIENSIASHSQDLSTTPMEDTQSYNEKTLQPEIPRNDDLTENFTPCDMEISSPI